MRIEDRVKGMIVRALRLNRAAESIADDCPLFDGGLGMDSVDALEVCVHLEKEFGAVVAGDDAAEVLKDVRSVARFILACGYREPA